MRIPLFALSLILATAFPAQEGAWHGRVVEDHSGMTLAAVSIRVSRAGVPGIVKEVESDRSGEFTITGLPPGAYEFTITKTNYMPAKVRVALQGDAPAIPHVRLVRYGVITGRLLPASSGGVGVFEQVPEGYAARRFVGASNSAGEFRAFGLPPGRYAVGTSVRGLSLHPTNAQPREFSIAGGEEYAGIDVQNPPASSFAVAGTVISPEPVSSYIVFLVSPDRPAISLSTRVFSGPFNLPNILPGIYEVLVSAGLPTGPQSYGRLRFSVAGQAAANLEVPVMPGRSAEFSVQSGACPQGATVTLSILEAWTNPTAARGKVSADLVDGKSARFDNLFPGRYQVSVRDSAGSCYGVTDRVLDLSGPSVAPRSIVLKPAPSIRGRVDATAAVVLRDLEPGRESPVQVVFVRAGGTFDFPRLAPGRYCLEAHTNDESRARWAPESGCASSPLDLSPGDAPDVNLRIIAN